MIKIMNNGERVTFRLCTGTIATVSTFVVDQCVQYISHGIIVPLDTIIDFTILGSNLRITIGDKWFACDATTNLPDNVSVSVKLTVGEFLDVLREGWLIV